MIPANTKAIGGRNIVGRSRRVLSVSSTGGDLDLLRSLPAPLDRRIEGLLGPLSTSNLLRSERTTKVARVWMSATPFVPLRFLKRRGANTLIGQVNAELVSREFTKRCLREINNYHAPVSGQPANVVLNPTGGFKALVPYLVLIGMLKKVPCRYIFEQSTTLLELPPLPVEFSRSRFEAFKALFERIERESAITLADWNAAVSFDERSPLEPLIEQDGDQVTLSAIGLLFLDEVRQPVKLVPFLSRQAWADCWDNLSQLSDCEPLRFLTRMSSPQLLDKHEHINVGHGLRWLKPGNTTDRYLVSVEDWRLLVWRAIREDQIGPDYPHKISVTPHQDRPRYAPFTRLEFTR